MTFYKRLCRKSDGCTIVCIIIFMLIKCNVVGVQLYKLFENTEKMYFVTIVIARDFLTYEVNFDCKESSINMTLTFLNKYYVKMKSTSLVGSFNLFPPSFHNIWLLYISFDAKACKIFINVPKYYQLSVTCCDFLTIL